MDPDLRAFTKFGEIAKIRGNFREIQMRLFQLERSNRLLSERLRVLELRLEELSGKTPEGPPPA
jgi:hypothetical protein